MTKTRLAIVIIFTLIVGLGAWFALLPIISSSSQEAATDTLASPINATAAPRGTQFFEANINEAQRVVAACRGGTVRGDECVNAETAIITIESKERFKRFRTEQR
jgi:hypothetical protein